MLTTTEMPSHNHGGTTGAPTISMGSMLMNDNNGWGAGNSRIQNSGGTGHDATRNYSEFQVTPPTVSGSSISSQGGGAAHNIVQPTIICNYIIRII